MNVHDVLIALSGFIAVVVAYAIGRVDGEIAELKRWAYTLHEIRKQMDL